jgi:hypothetical protein
MTVPTKTELGQEELRKRTHRLSQRHRTILLLVDGRRPLAEVLSLAQKAGASTSHFEELLRLGLVDLPDRLEPATPLTPPAGVGSVDAEPVVESFTVAQAPPAMPSEDAPLDDPAPAMERAEVMLAPETAGEPSVVSRPSEQQIDEPREPEPPRDVAPPKVEPAPPRIEEPPPAAEPVEPAPAMPVAAAAPPVEPEAPRELPPPPEVRPAVLIQGTVQRAARVMRPPARKVPMVQAPPDVPTVDREVARKPAAAMPDMPTAQTAQAQGAQRGSSSVPLKDLPDEVNPLAARSHTSAGAWIPDVPARLDLPTLDAQTESPPGRVGPEPLPAARADAADVLQQVRQLLIDTLRLDKPLFSARMFVLVWQAQTAGELIELVWEIQDRLMRARHAHRELKSLQKARELLGLGNTLVSEETRPQSLDDD